MLFEISRSQLNRQDKKQNYLDTNSIVKYKRNSDKSEVLAIQSMHKIPAKISMIGDH